MLSSIRGKVILFYPAYDGPPPGTPHSLLAPAGTLRDVVLIDAAIHSAISLPTTEPVRWRLNPSLLSSPRELWLSRLSKKLVKRSSPATGQPLPEQESDYVC